MFRLNWARFDSAVAFLTTRLVGRHVDGLYAVPRGGLPLAVALSHHLRVPLVNVGENERLPPNVWIVDDILDHGVTIERIRKQHGDAPAAVWLRRDRSAHVRDVEAVMQISDKEWVLFPWEDPVAAQREKADYEARRQ